MMLDEDRAVAPLLASPFNESNPAVSPDGAWIAYRSDESGRNEVYVDRFPDLGDRVQVSTGGGTSPTLVARRNRALLPRGPRDDRGPGRDRRLFHRGAAGRPETLFEGPSSPALAGAPLPLL